MELPTERIALVFREDAKKSACGEAFSPTTMLKLMYRSTFIDVEECISSDSSDNGSRATSPARLMEAEGTKTPPMRRRSKSAPANKNAENDGMNLSLGALAQRAEQFHTLLRSKRKDKEFSEVPPPSRQQTSSSSNSENIEQFTDVMSTASGERDFARSISGISACSLSSGSVGHPEVCRRPCMYFATGNCSKGTECEYCHMAHDGRSMHLDKRQREFLSKIPHEKFLALILHYLEAKALENSFQSAAKELLQLLRGFARLGSDEAIMVPELPTKMWSKLDYMLKKMTFQSLVSLAMKSKTGSDFADQISDAMSRMRQSLVTG